jgi:hypothetical protein
MSGAFALLLFPEIWNYFQENDEDACIVNVHFHDLHNTQDNFSLRLNNRLTPTRIDISSRYCVSYIYLVNDEIYNWSCLIVLFVWSTFSSSSARTSQGATSQKNKPW